MFSFNNQKKIKVMQHDMSIGYRAYRRFEYFWPEGEETALIYGRVVGDSPAFPDGGIINGQVFWLGNLELIVIDYSAYSDTYEVSLMDGRGYRRYLRRKYWYFYEKIKYRFILTAHVWRLNTITFDEFTYYNDKHIIWWFQQEGKYGLISRILAAIFRRGH